MNTNPISIVRTEVERLMRENSSSSGLEGGVLGLTYEDGIDTALNNVLEILSILSDLEKEEKPMNPDDAMKELDEKIALVKQRRTWDGVDVDKYMDEVRGREPDDNS